MLEKNRRWGWVQYGNTSKTLSVVVPCSVRVLARMLELDMPHGLCAEKYVLLSQDEINKYNCSLSHTQYAHTHWHACTQTWVKTCTTVAVRMQRLWPLEFRPTGRATHFESVQPVTVRAHLDQWRALERHYTEYMMRVWVGVWKKIELFVYVWECELFACVRVCGGSLVMGDTERFLLFIINRKAVRSGSSGF